MPFYSGDRVWCDRVTMLYSNNFTLGLGTVLNESCKYPDVYRVRFDSILGIPFWIHEDGMRLSISQEIINAFR